MASLPASWNGACTASRKSLLPSRERERRLDPVCCQLDPKTVSSSTIGTPAQPPSTAVHRGARLLGLDLRLVAIGVGGGLLSGLLGVGGGIVMVPLLVLWAGYRQRDAHAASLGAIIPISLASVLTYGVAGEVHPWEAVALAAGSIGGARIGAGALTRLDERRLKLVFGVFLGAVAILMLVRR